MDIRKLGVGAAGLVVAGAVAVGGLGAIGASAHTPWDGQQMAQGERPADGLGKPGGGTFRAFMGIHSAAAEVLGIDTETLRTALQSGKTLAQVGEEYGFSRDALKAGITSGVNQQLARAVADGKITEEQKATILEGLSARIDKMLDATHTGNMGPGGLQGAPRGNAAPPQGARPEGMHHGPRGPQQRRTLLYKYSPGNSAWSHEVWPAELVEACTPRQRLLLQPPSVGNHRPVQ